MKKPFFALFIVWVVYVLLSFLAPEAESVNRYGLTLAQANLLRVTILLPLLFIWGTALSSILRFRRYTAQVDDSAEAEGFRKITRGLWMLLLVLLLPGFIGVISTYYPESFEVKKASVITRNYLTIALYLAGFWYFWKASTDLVKSIGLKTQKARSKAVLGVGLLGLVTAYAWFIFQNPFRTVSLDPTVIPTYFLSDPVIFFTIIIPYAIIWLLGSLAVINIWFYAREVPGVIYRDTFTWVAYGLTLTVVLLISLQFLSQANASLSHAALEVVLIIIYLLLFAIAASYLLIAKGARKLSKIEEVK